MSITLPSSPLDLTRKYESVMNFLSEGQTLCEKLIITNHITIPQIHSHLSLIGQLKKKVRRSDNLSPKNKRKCLKSLNILQSKLNGIIQKIFQQRQTNIPLPSPDLLWKSAFSKLLIYASFHPKPCFNKNNTLPPVPENSPLF